MFMRHELLCVRAARPAAGAAPAGRADAPLARCVPGRTHDWGVWDVGVYRCVRCRVHLSEAGLHALRAQEDEP